jgi:hypothetical protein
LCPGQSSLALIQRRASEAFVAVLERIIHGAPLERRSQERLGTHFPPAGLSTIRRAIRNYARLTAMQSAAPAWSSASSRP